MTNFDTFFLRLLRRRRLIFSVKLSTPFICRQRKPARTRVGLRANEPASQPNSPLVNKQVEMQKKSRKEEQAEQVYIVCGTPLAEKKLSSLLAAVTAPN